MSAIGKLVNNYNENHNNYFIVELKILLVSYRLHTTLYYDTVKLFIVY